MLAFWLFIFARLLGNKLNQDQLLGCLLFMTLISLVSLALFSFRALPFKSLTQQDLVIKRSFTVAVLSLIFSFLQLPFWILLTGQFPPDHFSKSKALVATIGVVVALFGPAAPSIVMFYRQMAMANKAQRAAINEKKKANQALQSTPTRKAGGRD